MRRQIKRPRVLLTMRQEKRPRVLQKKKKALSDYCFKNGGERWIRTTEVCDNRFTVCPLWPLGNFPIMELVMGLEPATC